jgi:4-aminobutyrate aminotransferase/(S)-3-amino-2-methylpropionate transaminase
MASNAEWLQRLQAVECRDSSYNVKQDPLVFAQAQGSTVWDAEGRSYIDLCAGFGVMALGHNNEVQKRVFASSINQQALVTHGMGDVYPSIAKVELLETLAAALPAHLSKGGLALSGGQAVEFAVKTAQIATGAKGFINFHGSYHGLDLGILPLTSRRDFKDPFRGWLPEDRVTELPFACDLSIIRQAVHAQKAAGFGCAAVIVEPIQGRAGIRSHGLDWLSGLYEVCQQEKVLLIYDEVFTGLGRTGQMTFAELVPCDLLCLGKALGGGLPLSACFGRAELMDAWPQNEGEGIHTGTFFGHPLSCRLGTETLRVIQEQSLPQRALELGAKVQEMLRDTLHKHPLFVDVRGRGLMVGLELREPLAGAHLMDRLRRQGVIALASGDKGQGISITPALTIAEDELALAVERIHAAINEL